MGIIQSLIKELQNKFDVVYTDDHFYIRGVGTRFGHFTNKNTLILSKHGWNIKLTFGEKYVKFKICEDYFGQLSIVKIMDYLKSYNDDGMIDVYKLCDHYKTGAYTSLKVDNIIEEIERIFFHLPNIKFTEYHDYFIGGDKPQIKIEDIEKGTPFTLDEVIGMWCTINNLEVGIDFISDKQTIIEITDPNFKPYNLEDVGDININIKDLKEYLELHGCRIDVLKLVSSTLFLIDIRNKLEFIKDDKYNILKKFK